MSLRPRIMIVSLLAATLHGANAAPQQSEPTNPADLKAEAADLVARFGGTLKPLLKGALQNGGANEAIRICSTKAPEIAAELSASSGWEVTRVSLRPRNAISAAPDAWERSVLQYFEVQQQAGVAPESLSRSEKVEGHFRFMKAQPMDALCLTCHGQTLGPEVSEALSRHYPDDAATGYSLGEIRGAFSLSKRLAN